MKQRVFIAINLPEEIKRKLADYQKKWPELPIRWTKKDNLHITLEFWGYLSKEKLADVYQKTKELALKHKPFIITLTKICYGPLSGTPKMVWAIGERMVKEFGISPHITLGRIRAWEWRKIEPEERPEINEEINLSFEVNSIEIMESVLKKSGPEYIILETCNLKHET